MQCSNCDESALYQYSPKGIAPAAFCAAHLPSFLSKSAKAGLLETTEHYESLRVSAFEALRPQQLPETAVEEQPAETPRKRRNRKKAEAEVTEVTQEEPAVEDAPDTEGQEEPGAEE
jgi:hypothetical protein